MDAVTRFRAIRFIQLSLIVMPGVFAVIVYYLIAQGEVRQSPTLYWLVQIGFVVVAGFVSQVLYKSTLAKAFASTGLEQKLAFYSQAVLLRNAPWEGAALLSGALALLNQDPMLLIPYPVIAVVMFILRPTPETARVDLGLTWDETQQLTRR